MTTKIAALTVSQKDALVRVADAFAKGETDRIDVAFETLEAFCSHDLVNFTQCGSGGDWWLTEKGTGVVNERRREQEEQKAKRSAASKRRSSTLRSLGLRRVAGGWE